MPDDLKNQRPTTPVPPSSTREPASGSQPASGLRRRSSGNPALKPHQHVVADRAIRDLRVQLNDAKRTIKTNADDLERATTEALRVQAEIVSLQKEIDCSRDRESESARQWIAMSGELGAARARLERYERVLRRVRERAEALCARARDEGNGVDAELREILAILELHAPEGESR